VPGVRTAVLRTFPASDPSKTGLVTTRWFPADPHHRPRLAGKVQTGPRDALNPSPLGSRQAGNVGTTGGHPKFPHRERLRLKAPVFRVSKVRSMHAVWSSLHAARTDSQQQVTIHETFFMS
jgi:hypothetical protein